MPFSPYLLSSANFVGRVRKGPENAPSLHVVGCDVTPAGFVTTADVMFHDVSNYILFLHLGNGLFFTALHTFYRAR